MTIQIIPTANAPCYQQSTTLEGVTFGLAFAWNAREACWYMSIADVDGIDIAVGEKLVCRRDFVVPILRKCRDPRRPAGDFIVVSSTNDVTPPGLNDLLPGSGRCTLYYVTSDLLALRDSGQLQQAIDALNTGTQDTAASPYGQS